MTNVNLGPAAVNVTGVRAGDRNLMTATITSGGAAVDLTGMTVTAQARKKPTDIDPPAITAAVTIDDAPAGRVSIRWPGDQVATVLDGKAKWAGVWDMQILDGVEDPWTVCSGSFKAEMDVTR